MDDCTGGVERRCLPRCLDISLVENIQQVLAYLESPQDQKAGGSLE